MPRFKRSERDDMINETRQLLLAAATEAFAENGYEGANVNSISKAAGYAKGTIYNYFDSKRALMLAVLDGIADKHLTYVQDRVLQEEDPSRRLELFFKAGFDFIAKHLTHARVMLNAINSPDSEFKQRMFEAYSPMFQMIAQDIIQEGITLDQFRKVDVDPTAGLIMNIYLGTGSQVNDEGQPWLAPEEVADFALRALEKRS